MAPMWKKLMKHVDLDEPTPFLDHVYYQDGGNLMQKHQHGPMTWKDTPKNAWRDIVNRQTKRQSNCTKFQVLAWIIITSRKKNLNQLENYQKFARKLY